MMVESRASIFNLPLIFATTVPSPRSATLVFRENGTSAGSKLHGQLPRAGFVWESNPKQLLGNRMKNLANSYADFGRRDEALKLREQALELRRKVNGPDARPRPADDGTRQKQ